MSASVINCAPGMCVARYSSLSPTCSSTIASSLRCFATHSVETISDDCTLASSAAETPEPKPNTRVSASKTKACLFISSSGESNLRGATVLRPLGTCLPLATGGDRLLTQPTAYDTYPSPCTNHGWSSEPDNAAFS